MAVAQKRQHIQFRSVTTESDSINVLLTGKTGVGKSSIINAILGQPLAKEGKALGGVTRDVTCHEAIVNGVRFQIWDSPGLQDITEDDGTITTRIEETLRTNCRHLHLLLYCIRMDRDRVEVSELNAIKQLSKIFTTKIWDTAVFALTYANRVLPPDEMETDEEETKWFKERIKEFKETVIRALVESGVSQVKAKEVTVIPVGYHTPTRRMSNPRELFDRLDWFNPFWNSCANHMEENAVIPLLKSQKHRIKVVSGKTSSEEAMELAGRQQELKKKEKDLEKQSSSIDKKEFEKRYKKVSDELREIEEKRRKIREAQQTKAKVCLNKLLNIILNLSIIM